MANLWEVFAHHWRQRGRLVGIALTIDEAEFLPPTLALEARPVSPAARLTAIGLTMLVAVALGWATLGQLDIVVRAQGKIIAAGETKVVASVETAKVRSIDVVEGQAVRKGDLLLE